MIKLRKKIKYFQKRFFNLKNSISKFHKGKDTFNNLLNSQIFSSEKFQLDFSKGASTSSSPLKSIKATWDDSSVSKMEEEQQELSNLCFMAMEDTFEVPLLYNSSCDYSCDDELDDNSSLIRKLFLKCQTLLLKKKVYK